MMKNEYIHIGDFEKYVRNRFKNIINGNGLVIPRIAIKVALDDIFNTPNKVHSPDHEHTPYHTGSGEIICSKCGHPCGGR